MVATPPFSLFTSESVSEGHPDKLCDQISDAVLDAILALDSEARVACETLAKTGAVIVAGEIRTQAWVDIESIVREVVTRVGYTGGDSYFDGSSCAVINMIGCQSPDIAMGVDETEDRNFLGAGDQGLMFGFACDETAALMPAPIHYAHQLVRRQAMIRRTKLDWLRPDAKSQVTFRYDEAGQVESVDTVVLSTQHAKGIDIQSLRKQVQEHIIEPTLPARWFTDQTRVFINPTGCFEIGGPLGDCGLTGRKIIVDTYGGYARHGGGAFSGKDATKVDRSAAYMARYIAKHIVAAGLAKSCEIQLSYAIGVADPTSVRVDTFGSSAYSSEQLSRAITEVFDMTPKGIVTTLGLNKPIYSPTAAYGHFGREDLDLPWERLDKLSELKACLKV